MSVSLLIQIHITIFSILNNEKYQQLLNIFNENTDVITAAKMSMVMTVKKNTDKEMMVSVGNRQIIAAIITSCMVD